MTRGRPAGRNGLLCYGGLFVLLLGATTMGYALEPFCTLQKIEVKRLSNGFLITLQADGLIQLSSLGYEVWRPDEEGNWQPLSDRIRFGLPNVQGGATALYQIAQYPISHLEFALPPGQRHNIGLQATLVLYKPGLVTLFQGSEEDDWDVQGWRRPDCPIVLITLSQKRDAVLITVFSDRSEEPAPARPEPTPAPTRLSLSGPPEALSLQALHASLPDVFRALAQHTGTAICVDESVSGSVTTHFAGVPLATLLALLCRAYGLAVRQIDNVYYVSACRADSATTYELGETRALPLRYLSANEALLLLPDIVLPYVRPAAEGNALIASGPAALVEQLAAHVAALDRPTYHCRLRAWALSRGERGEDLWKIMTELASGETRLSLTPEGRLSLSLGPAQPRQLQTKLSALVAARRVCAQRLATLPCLNGRTATLFLGARLYYWRYPRRGVDQYLERVPIGTQISFSPRTDGQIITAKVSVQSDASLGSGGAPVYGPLVARRRAQATICLPSGGTIIIGGLALAQTTRQRDLMPAVPPSEAVATGYLRIRPEEEIALLVEMTAETAAPRGEMPAG